MGEWDTSTDSDCENGDCADPPVDIAVEQLIPHESYNPNSKTQENDIALLRLSRSAASTGESQCIAFLFCGYPKQCIFYII